MNLRILSAALLAIAGFVLWPTATTASVTGLTSPEGETYEGSISAEAEGHVVLDNPLGSIQCDSDVGVALEVNGEEARAGGPVTSLVFSGCTEGWHVTVVSAGALSVEHTEGDNGYVFSTGATIEATKFGISCRYATTNTKIGTLTGGSPATLDIQGAIPFHSGSFFCSSSPVNWTGSYSIAAPEVIKVDDLLRYKSEPAGEVFFFGALGPTQNSVWGFEKTNATCTQAEYQSAGTKTPAKKILFATLFKTCSNFKYAGGSTNSKECWFEIKQPSKALESKGAIRCVSGKFITLRGEEGANSCEVHIGEPGNHNLTKNRYQDLEGKFEVIFEWSGITAEVTTATGNCPLNKGVIENVTYKARVNIEDLWGKSISIG